MNMSKIDWVFHRCQKCGEFHLHPRLEETTDACVQYALKQVAYHKKRADRYREQLELFQGKTAVLKHENNKLRKRITRENKNE